MEARMKLIGCAVAFVMAVVLVASTPAQPGAGAAAKSDRYTVIRCGQLLAVPGDAPPGAPNGVYRDAALVIKNDLVFQVVPSFAQLDLSVLKRDGAEITELDLSDSFVMPGLID